MNFRSKLWMNLPKTGGELVIRFGNTKNLIDSGVSIMRSLTASEFGYEVLAALTGVAPNLIGPEDFFSV
ncbi:hypothetical protein [Tychonema sp. BBK16]|uniref:hypothetical protein n=1 Tax=Tychonema sp. BBK16 TaxID=2699888 RepID=UPI001F35307D|nr:hypothetical protein [Tychonema sp. BBK16]MCF6374328.1 hypothetical protein [Tychonema sp. BBK16]